MKSIQSQKPTTLQRILTTAVNDLSMDVTVAILNQAKGPLIPQVTIGFTEREVRTLLRALSVEEGSYNQGISDPNGFDSRGAFLFRIIMPGPKNLLAVSLKNGEQIYGVLILGKRAGSAISKRDRTSADSLGETITKQLREANLFDPSVILGRPWVAQEPIPDESQEKLGAGAHIYTSPQVQARISTILSDAQEAVPFDRAWVTLYDPVIAALEVLGSIAGHKKELAPGHRLSLNDSASGWAVRHRKPRIDKNLASTQGRFHDYKQLYRDRFRCTLVVPFFVRGRVGGTVTLASKTSALYGIAETESQKLELVATQLAALFEDPTFKLSLFSASDPRVKTITDSSLETPSEPIIRRQERQTALNEVSSFLAAEVREPMRYIRAQLEEITGEGSLDFESQARVEAAMRDLIRLESMLHEILDFAKPLELERKLWRVPLLVEEALALIATDVKVNRILVTKEFPSRLGQVRWDKEKMQHAFLSIFKNALEAMSPGGHLQIAASQRGGRQPVVILRIQNDGAPIPEDLMDKIFEPYFTTKRSGTGLGLAMVKKIVEEHHGQISIKSSLEDGTLVRIKLPALRPRGPYRRVSQPPRRSRGQATT